MQSDHVYDRLADDLIKWQTLLQSVRKSRTTFDTSEREKQFGPIVVSYELVSVHALTMNCIWVFASTV